MPFIGNKPSAVPLTSADIADGIITSAKIVDGTIATADLNTGLTVNLGAGAVGTPTLTTSGDTNTGIFFPAADTIGFAEGGTEAMRIDSSGQVGIGTSSPLAQLSVQTTAGSNTGFLRFNDVTYGGQIRFGKNEGISNDAVLGTWGANNTLIFTDSTERMRILSSGKIVFNTTAQNSNEQVGMVYSSNSGVGFSIQDSNAQNGNTFIQFRNGATVAGTITSNGTTTTSYNTSSDYRLKENVIYNLNGIERIKLLKPARFNFISGTQTVDGFLAHEVSNVVPEAIHGTKDQVEAIGNITDDEGNIIRENVTEPNELSENQTWTQTGTRPVYQGIDQSKLVPLLTGALQEAIAKIESLEARLTALENI